MKFLDLLPTQPTWETIDASKLSTYMSCPRKYFYSYVLGWRMESENVDLVFGTAWHIALEHLMRERFRTSAVEEAYDLFLASFRAHFPEEENDEMRGIKTPANALTALELYHAKHKHEAHKYAVLHTEIGGTVTISSVYEMAFKMDAILQDTTHGTIFGMDHKTSGRFYANWGEKWLLSTQMLTYIHAMGCFYGVLHSNVPQMLVRTTFLHDQSPLTATGRKRKPTEHETDDFWIVKTAEQMQRWLRHVSTWLTHLHNDMQQLVWVDNTDHAVMDAFPMNDTACFSYGRLCHFLTLCNAWQNPLTRCTEPPYGMQVRFWNPLEAPEIREVVEIK